jgi:hypothetical protein
VFSSFVFSSSVINFLGSDVSDLKWVVTLSHTGYCTYIMVVWFMTPCSLVDRHQHFVRSESLWWLYINTIIDFLDIILLTFWTILLTFWTLFYWPFGQSYWVFGQPHWLFGH